MRVWRELSSLLGTRVLETYAEVLRSPGSRVTEIAERTGISRQVVWQNVKRLERHGFVEVRGYRVYPLKSLTIKLTREDQHVSLVDLSEVLDPDRLAEALISLIKSGNLPSRSTLAKLAIALEGVM